MTTPQMDLAETLDFWQREIDRDAADPRERTRDGIASSTLHWLRELEAMDWIADIPVALLRRLWEEWTATQEALLCAERKLMDDYGNDAEEDA
jgi:hypothetical protein